MIEILTEPNLSLKKKNISQWNRLNWSTLKEPLLRLRKIGRVINNSFKLKTYKVLKMFNE